MIYKTVSIHSTHLNIDHSNHSTRHSSHVGPSQPPSLPRRSLLATSHRPHARPTYPTPKCVLAFEKRDRKLTSIEDGGSFREHQRCRRSGGVRWGRQDVRGARKQQRQGDPYHLLLITRPPLPAFPPFVT